MANWEEKKEGSERHLGSDMHGYTTAHLRVGEKVLKDTAGEDKISPLALMSLTQVWKKHSWSVR